MFFPISRLFNFLYFPIFQFPIPQSPVPSPHSPFPIPHSPFPIPRFPFCPPFCLSVCLFVCLSVCLAVCLSVWLAVCLSVCLSDFTLFKIKISSRKNILTCFSFIDKNNQVQSLQGVIYDYQHHDQLSHSAFQPACKLSLRIWDTVYESLPIPPPPALHSDSFVFLCPNYIPKSARRACTQATAPRLPTRTTASLFQT